MIRLAHLIRNDRAAAAIEFAIALPVLMLLIYGIFIVGLLFQANAGMQHALGEGARFATLWPTPSDNQIRDRILDESFGTANGTFTVPMPTTGTGFKELTVTYSTPTDFLFVPGPTVTITRTKRVYTAS